MKANSKENTQTVLDAELMNLVNTPAPDGLVWSSQVVTIPSSQKTDQERKEEILETAAMDLICAKLNTDPEDIMLPEIVDISYNKSCSKMQFDLEYHQFFQKTRKFQIHVNVEEVHDGN